MAAAAGMASAYGMPAAGMAAAYMAPHAGYAGAVQPISADAYAMPASAYAMPAAMSTGESLHQRLMGWGIGVEEAGKLVGMILELSPDDQAIVLASEEQLRSTIAECQDVLREAAKDEAEEAAAAKPEGGALLPVPAAAVEPAIVATAPANPAFAALVHFHVTSIVTSLVTRELGSYALLASKRHVTSAAG